jgi:hypothetical protein
VLIFYINDNYAAHGGTLRYVIPLYITLSNINIEPRYRCPNGGVTLFVSRRAIITYTATTLQDDALKLPGGRP